MKKLKDLIKESWLTGNNGSLKKQWGNIELGKVYTQKDMKPFQTPKQVNEADRRPPKDEYFVREVTTVAKSLKDMIRIFPKTSFIKIGSEGKHYFKQLKTFEKFLINNTKNLLGYNESVEVNEADLEKGGSSLPSKLKNYMGRFTDEVNKAKLNKIKKVAILFKIIKSLGLTPQELSMYVTKMKKEI